MTSELAERRCVPLLVSRCRHVTEIMNMSVVQHVVAVSIVYVSCMLTGEEVNNGQVVVERLLRETEMVRKSILEVPMNIMAIFRDENKVDQEDWRKSSEELFIT